jgi:hypothetical protein
MYMGYLKVESTYTCSSLVQATYTSITSQKRKQQSRNQSREYWYGRPESLQTHTLAETQKKVIKPI